jgi:hypothetical protein
MNNLLQIFLTFDSRQDNPSMLGMCLAARTISFCGLAHLACSFGVLVLMALN